MLITTATSTDEAKRGATVALLPVGSFEQHGDHLPLTTDTLVACVIANQLAITYNLFLLPPITMSCSHEHESFEGTVSISSRTLIAMIDDTRSSLVRSGIRYLVLVNGHGGSYVLSNIAQERTSLNAVLPYFQVGKTSKSRASAPGWRPPPAKICTAANGKHRYSCIHSHISFVRRTRKTTTTPRNVLIC
jgi:creatinine amidohydrolase/Fe(II)-dependent formamide hydrolase-like protein